MANTIDTLATALHDLRGRLGDDAFGDKRRVISLLSDKLPGARREIRAVGTAIDEGVPGALTGSQREYVGWEMDRQADKLENSTGLNIDLARQTVRALAYSLDLGPLPSIYPAGPVTPAPPPPSQPPGNGWLGDSVVPNQPPRGFVSPSSQPPSVPASGGWPPQPFGQGLQGGYRPADGSTPRWSPQQSFVAPPTKPKMARVNKILLGVVIALVAFIGWAISLAQHDEADKGKTPTATSSTVTPGVPTAGGGPGDESQDFGVAPRAELQVADQIATPTPTSIPGATTVTTTDLKRMIGADPAPQLIDALNGNHPVTIQGAVAMPFAGFAGSFNDSTQKDVATALETLPAAQQGRPLVFFCAGVKCWESYNAVLRANAAGAKNLYWYRGGLDAWEASGGPTQPPGGGAP